MKIDNIVGKTFGKLKVLEVIRRPRKSGGQFDYVCRVLCEQCNRELIMGKASVIHGSGICRPCAYSQTKRGLLHHSMKDLTGQTFGNLTVIGIDGLTTNLKHRSYWKCQCNCGNMTSVSGQSLKSGSTKSCGCKSVRVGKNSPYWIGYEDISGTFWEKVKFNAMDRNIPFELTIEDAWNIFKNQNEKCALTREPISFGRRTKDIHTASLDRIDSSKGYTKDNVQWVHVKINFLKGALSEIELYHWCELLMKYKK